VIYERHISMTASDLEAYFISLRLTLVNPISWKM